MREGPEVTIKRSCSGCTHVRTKDYAVQGDSGFTVSCALAERWIGDTTWATPAWCPVLAAPASPPVGEPAPAPIWTTTACPHCGGEVDGIRVLTAAEVGRPAPAEHVLIDSGAETSTDHWRRTAPAEHGMEEIEAVIAAVRRYLEDNSPRSIIERSEWERTRGIRAAIARLDALTAAKERP
jgi:hypothetical protein